MNDNEKIAQFTGESLNYMNDANAMRAALAKLVLEQRKAYAEALGYQIATSGLSEDEMVWAFINPPVAMMAAALANIL